MAGVISLDLGGNIKSVSLIYKTAHRKRRWLWITD